MIAAIPGYKHLLLIIIIGWWQTLKTEIHNDDIFSLVGKHRKAIMGFAALIILMFHKYRCIFPADSFLYQIESSLVGCGGVGVDIFFLISGIGLTYSIKKTSIGIFYYKRIKRLIIPFWLIGIVRGLFDHLSIMEIIGNITGVNFWTKNILSLLWFVPAIATFYFLFPLYYKFFEKSKNKYIFTSIIISVWLLLSLSFIGLLQEVGRLDFYMFTNRIPVFLIGVLFGWTAQQKKVVFSGSVWVLVGLVNAIGLFLMIQNEYLLVPYSQCFLPCLLLSISLTFILAKLFDVFFKLRFCKIITAFFSAIGVVSLEMYCLQGAVDYLVDRYFSAFPAVVYNLLVFISVMIISYLLYAVEKLIWKLSDSVFLKRKVNAEQK